MISAAHIPSRGASTPVRRHPSAWVLWPTMGATWIAFAQILSFQGLAVWVVGGSLLTALVVLPLALAGRRLLAVAAMVIVTFAVPFLAEWLGGSSAGPVTRSSLMACAVVGAMSIVLPTRYPLAVVPLSLMLLGGAMGLGVTGSVLWLVGLWTVAATVTVAMLGPYLQRDLRARTRLIPFALLLGGAGIVAVVAVAIAAPVLRTPWTIPGGGVATVSEAVLPVTADAPSTSSSASSSEETPAIDARPPDEEVASTAPSWLVWLAWALVTLLALVLLVCAALLVRGAWVAILWRLQRRRLAQGTAAQRAIGAWTWVRMRRARFDRPLPRHLSPDVAVSWASRMGEPDIHGVAAIAASVAFNPAGAVSPEQADRAWVAALAAGRRPSASWRSRLRWSGRGPGQVRGWTTVTPAKVDA